MTDTQSVISILGCVFLLIYVIMNLSYVSDHGLYKKKYDELERGVYKYEPNVGQSHYFYLYSYDIHTLTFTRTDVDIIFFLDGDIKLTDNLYIHKNHLFMSLYSWYYYRKFHKLKNVLIRNYERESEVREAYIRASELRKKQNKLDFKFLRG
jgi:hypothetical protein